MDGLLLTAEAIEELLLLLAELSCGMSPECSTAPSPEGEEGAAGPSVQEFAEAQDGVHQQDELEEEREVVREPGARRVQNLKKTHEQQV